MTGSPSFEADLRSEVLGVRPPPWARELHVNYRYMLAWSQALAARPSRPRILDFGCGEGEVVKAGQLLGLELFGADAFYEGEADREKIRSSGLLGRVVREIRGGQIPFEDDSFDLILSNQVFEHVENLEGTLGELARILKREGLLVALFPTREVIREAHCGVPFLHWFSKGDPRRLGVTELLSWFGSGFDKERKSRREWAADALGWIDRYVFYRPRADILAAFARRFHCRPAEEHYLAYRLSGRFRALAPLLRVPWARELARATCRRWNGLVLTATKRLR